ncbi:MAG: hypothetical protein HUU01_08425 [Saprospiraceae bacterium]|nr:hypothetical protein [Saprospiraceae bacterium]
MTKLQLTAVFSAALLLFVMYFGCETKTKEIQRSEKSRALSSEKTDINLLLKDARSTISEAQHTFVLTLEEQLETANSDSAKVAILKQLSGKWYEFGHPAIAGHYAQNVAELSNSEEAWSIAGTTFGICVQEAKDDIIREFCSKRAIGAFENAVSLNPENITHKVNLALSYAEFPPADQPMKGPLMLLDLNRQQPENVLVLNSLARLAIKTGQFDRALTRLEKAVQLEPENVSSNCLLATVYESLKKTVEAQQYLEKCRALQAR